MTNAGFDCEFLIVGDDMPARHATPRASAIHARTLELLAPLGVADRTAAYAGFDQACEAMRRCRGRDTVSREARFHVHAERVLPATDQRRGHAAASVFCLHPHGGRRVRRGICGGIQPRCRTGSRSLAHAGYNLMRQSLRDGEGRQHAHGWGLAAYLDGKPVLSRETRAAFEDEGLEQLRLRMRAATRPAPRALVRGQTDSEHLRHFILSHWSESGSKDLAECVREALAEVLARREESATGAFLGLNVVLTNGRQRVASRVGRTLWFLEHEGEAPCASCGTVHATRRVPGGGYRAIERASENPARCVLPEACVLGVDAAHGLRLLPLTARPAAHAPSRQPVVRMRAG